MVSAVDQVLASINDSTKVIPGHGAVTDRATLRAYRDMLATVRDRVAAQVRSGATLDKVLASKPTAEFDGTFGAGFIKPADFVGFAYADATRRKPVR